MTNDTLARIKETGFWFVDIPRTSSSSIKVELGMAYGFPYGKSNLLEKQYSTNQGIDDHLSVKKLKDFMGAEMWRGLYSFSFVRNPWDRMVSMYFYRLLKKAYSEQFTFRDYILQLKMWSEGGKAPLFAQHYFYFGCSDYIYDGDNCLVSYVGRYENRASDIQKISSAINCPQLGKLHIQKAASDKKCYSHYYDDETREIVEKLYKNDIKRFGYEFKVS